MLEVLEDALTHSALRATLMAYVVIIKIRDAPL